MATKCVNKVYWNNFKNVLHGISSISQDLVYILIYFKRKNCTNKTNQYLLWWDITESRLKRDIYSMITLLKEFSCTYTLYSHTNLSSGCNYHSDITDEKMHRESQVTQVYIHNKRTRGGEWEEGLGSFLHSWAVLFF